MATKKKNEEPLRLIEKKYELLHKDNINELPNKLRGIYVLYKTSPSDKPRTPFRNVVYVGMSASGIKGRLRSHRHQKGEHWDTCSVFSVWPNVRMEEIRELEGILRHIYRFDAESQALAKQLAYLKLKRTEDIVLSKANRKAVEWVDDDEDEAEKYN